MMTTLTDFWRDGMSKMGGGCFAELARLAGSEFRV